MRRGYTLIEVLVALCILGALAMVTLPIVAGCIATAPVNTEISITFTGKVMNHQTVDESDGDDGTIQVHYVDVNIDGNNALESFTIDDHLPLEDGKHYAFRAWNSEPHRHLSEAIPIP